MSIRFGGQSYQTQCPVCYAALQWSRTVRDARERIERVAGQHYKGCPATVLDPPRLVGLSAEQAMELIADL
jgi:hypothetical protein